MYGATAAMMLLPTHALKGPSRTFFCRTLARVLLPTQPVSWADFLLADILTSLAKSSSDLSRSTCLILHGEACGWVPQQELTETVLAHRQSLHSVKTLCTFAVVDLPCCAPPEK